jgi:hypothetical protein
MIRVTVARHIIKKHPAPVDTGCHITYSPISFDKEIFKIVLLQVKSVNRLAVYFRKSLFSATQLTLLKKIVCN